MDSAIKQTTYTGDVLPIIRKVDKLTKKASIAETRIPVTALAVQSYSINFPISSINGVTKSSITAEIGAW